MSSKGQIVVPSEMRQDISEGEKLVLIKNHGQFIMKKAKDMSKTFEDDLEFAKRTEEAWLRYDRKDFVKKSMGDFLEDLDSW